MIFLLVSLLIFGLSLTGAGCFAGRLFGFRSARNPWIYWWFGFLTVSTLAMFSSLFFPVNTISLMVFFVIGIAGLPLLLREYKRSIEREASERESKTLITIFVYCAVAFLFGIACLLSVTELMGAYDTALYHAQTVRWMNEYVTPPGLGNVHTRLAFNSSWLSFGALLDNGPWDNRSECLLPALCWIGAFLYFLHELLFARRKGVQLYALCILAWSLYSVIHISPNLYYDMPVHVINAIVALEVYYTLAGTQDNPLGERTNGITGILLLSVGAFMIKPIGAVSVLFTGVLTVFLLWQNKKPLTAWVKTLCPALFALGVWVVRNIILSGYPLYPLPILPLPLDWTMTHAATQDNYIAVLGWARMPGPGYRESLDNGFLFWFKPWLAGNLSSRDFLVWAAFPVLLSTFFWILVVRFAKSRKALFFMAWSNLNILYWFLTAPDSRFGSGFFWVALALSLLCLFAAESAFPFSDLWNNKIVRWTFRYVWVLAIIGSMGMTVVSSKRSFFTVGTAQSFPVKEYTVEADTPWTIWIPLDPSEDRTGNSPLPSAPGPVNIEMRKPGDLAQGFRHN
ncbi:MAG: hypothetical protein LBK61_14470 [Spirochaetaceae bacterium]|jgi:hypothetical protein|nr:hypothetical protein [Spirochaetaceae bacterium]